MGEEKLANFLPDNMGMLYKSLREANPEKGLYIKMYNFGPEQIKYISFFLSFLPRYVPKTEKSNIMRFYLPPTEKR